MVAPAVGFSLWEICGRSIIFGGLLWTKWLLGALVKPIKINRLYFRVSPGSVEVSGSITLGWQTYLEVVQASRSSWAITPSNVRASAKTNWMIMDVSSNS